MLSPCCHTLLLCFQMHVPAVLQLLHESVANANAYEMNIEGDSLHAMQTLLPWFLICASAVMQLLHEGIAKFNGYEINTEGDSFHIAFTSVAAAVQVAMETQVRLLDSDWPKDVLKLPACGQVLTHSSTHHLCIPFFVYLFFFSLIHSFIY